MTINSSSLPEIYVADLAAYNSGILRGNWINATQDVSDIQIQIDEMLQGSTEFIAESWAIHGYQCFYGAGDYLGEHPNLEDVARTAQLISEHGELAGLVIAYFCSDIDEAQEALEERYCGEYDSLADYAEEFSEASVMDIPHFIAQYIDYERMGGDVFTLKTDDGTVHIFWNH